AAATLGVAWERSPDGEAPQMRPGALFVDAVRDRVRPDEAGTAGRAALAAYVHRFSAANAHALAAFGMTPDYLREARRGCSTFELRLPFGGPLRPGDLVQVRSAVVHVGNSSLRLLHAMTTARGGDPVAVLDQAGVHLDLEARRPAPLPASLRDRALAML